MVLQMKKEKDELSLKIGSFEITANGKYSVLAVLLMSGNILSFYMIKLVEFLN